MRRFRGAGCHPDRAIALARALAEAAQTRLTYIVGSRDDLPLCDYEAPANADLSEALLDALQASGGPCLFDDVPSFSSDDISDDVAWELERLRNAGAERVVAVDLKQGCIGVPVVRVVVPGLEGDCRNAEYSPGLRARAVMEGRSCTR
jgi:ribosomal protein S12 methylthiotransferase accessory factor